MEKYCLFVFCLLNYSIFISYLIQALAKTRIFAIASSRNTFSLFFPKTRKNKRAEREQRQTARRKSCPRNNTGSACVPFVKNADCAKNDGKRDGKVVSASRVFLFDCCVVSQLFMRKQIPRSHHRRPVERRDVVVQVVRPAVPLQVRLDRLLVELAFMPLRGSAGRGVFDVMAGGMTTTQHPL